MEFIQNLKRKWAQEYIRSLPIIDKSKEEKSKYMVEVQGEHIDDLIDPPEKIPFVDTRYMKNEKEAIELGKVEVDKGRKVEIWKLIKRWR